MNLRRADKTKPAERLPYPSLINSAETKPKKVENFMTLKQACSSEYQGAQGAFKDSMIH